MVELLGVFLSAFAGLGLGGVVMDAGAVGVVVGAEVVGFFGFTKGWEGDVVGH